MPYYKRDTRLIQIVGIIITAITGLIICGCAATKIVTHAIVRKPPLCQMQSAPESALVLWGPAWRENQKEIALREDIASRAINQFFTTSPCYSKVEVLKSVAGRSAIELSDAQALKFAVASNGGFDKVIILRVEELGPLVLIHPSPILWEGGTEVVLRIRVLNTKTSSVEADVTSHWKNGGAFVLKGTKTLERDMEAALTSVFIESSRSDQ